MHLKPFVVVGTILAITAGVFAFMLIKPGEKPVDTHGAAPGAANLPQSLLTHFHDGYSYQMEGRSKESLSEFELEFELRDVEWNEKASFVKLSAGIDEVVSRWKSTLDDPLDALTDAEEEHLLFTLAEHASVRAADSPSEFITLVEATPTLDWNERFADHLQIFSFYQLFIDHEMPAGASNREVLDDVWRGLRDRDHLFDEVGYGDQGAIILVRSIRVPSQIRDMGFAGKYPYEGDMDYWTSIAYRLGMAFTTPTVDLDTTLAEHSMAKVAYVHVLVRLRDGRIANWNSAWFLDPETGEWVNPLMQTSSSKTSTIVW